MKEYKRYYFKDETVLTIVYEFNTEQEAENSGLLNDTRRTTCFISGGKYYIGGHFLD